MFLTLNTSTVKRRVAKLKRLSPKKQVPVSQPDHVSH